MQFVMIAALILGLTSSTASAPTRDDFVPDEKEEGCACGGKGCRKKSYGRMHDAGELALVARGGVWQDASIKGVASLCVDDIDPVIEWGTTDRETMAALGRALRRLGWPGAPTLAPFVYGSAS